MNAQQIDIENSEHQEQYDDILNDVYGEIRIDYFTFDSADVLKEMHPTGYASGFNDWADNQPQWECSNCKIAYFSEEKAEECCSEED